MSTVNIPRHVLIPALTKARILYHLRGYRQHGLAGAAIPSLLLAGRDIWGSPR